MVRSASVAASLLRATRLPPMIGGRDGIRRWSEATKFVEAEFGVFCVDPNGVVGDVPAHVHGDVLPAEGFQICGHEVG